MIQTERQPNIPISEHSIFFNLCQWKPGSIQFFYIGLPERPRSQNLSYFRWWHRGSVPLSI